MVIGDTVVRKSYNKDITFKIIDIKEIDGKIVYILKGISIRIIAVNTRGYRHDISQFTRSSKSQKKAPNNELIFGRPGKILHIDGDKDYLDMLESL